MSFGIIVKKYEHFNRSFKGWDSPKGKYIRSKRDYEEEMKRQGMIPQEVSDNYVDNLEKKLEENQYKGISKDAERLIRSVHKDRDGKIKLSDRQVDEMKKIGVKVELPDWCPKHYKENGGLCSDN
jgi:hypothetical protein